MRIDSKKTYVWSSPQGFAECHASTLVELLNGDLLCAFFAGTHEGHDDVGIFWAINSKGRWGRVMPAAKVAPVAHWNPVLFRDRDGCLTLFFKAGKMKCEDTLWKTYVRRSYDEGQNWSDPDELVPGDESGGRGPVKNKPIQLADGTIVAPASKEHQGWAAFVDLSVDGGLTWERSDFVTVPPEPVPDDEGCLRRVGVIQPTIWESLPGIIHMLFRSSVGRIYRSDSTDGGRSWCEMYPTTLENNNSGIDLVKRPDGSLILAHNPTVRNIKEKISGRHKLVLSLSRDNGETWECMATLENEHPNQIVDVSSGRKHEYSYPAIILLRDGTLAVSYTHNRKNIVVVELSARQIKT